MYVKLKRTPTGYATADGRWTVEPATMGAGVNGNGGWSNGRREWKLTDTTGQAQISQYGNRAQKTVRALYVARSIIAQVA